MIIGVDEVNFSPSLAGDCVVCAYVASKKVRGVKDSKQLTSKQRLKLFEKLHETGSYSIVLATVNDINELGIYKARNLAIEFAIYKLIRKVRANDVYYQGSIEKVLIDGYFKKEWLNDLSVVLKIRYFGNYIPVECMVNGDELVYEISAASIVARVYADALFAGFGKFYPGYNLERCHGSPDKTMYKKLRESGPTPYHRTNYGLGWWEKIMAGKRRHR